MSNSPYSEILTELHRRHVTYVLGGGLACVLQGVERVTMDVDVAVLMSPDNLEKFIGSMEGLRLKPRVPVSPRQLLDPAEIRRMVADKQALVFTFVDPDEPLRQVDLFLTPELSYERLVTGSEWLDLEGVPVRVLTKAKLLELKLGIKPARAKDLVDIEFLRHHVEDQK